MKTKFHALTDAEGHTIGDHVAHLQRSLDSFGRKLRDAVSAAVGDTVSGTVQAVLRTVLADLTGLTPVHEEAPPPRYGSSSYWGESYDEWGGSHGSYRGSPADDGDDVPRQDTPNRWPLVAFVGGRLLASLLQKLPTERRWLSAAGVGVLVVLAIATGLPGAGLFRSTLSLTSLADMFRGGVAVVSQLTS